MPDTDNPFAPLTKAEYAEMMTSDSTEDAPADGSVKSPESQSEQQDQTTVPDAVTPVETSAPKPLVKRRVVTKTQIGHVAQDIIMNGVLALVQNFRNDPSIMERVAELGLSADDFEPVITKQATRVAKALRFEVA